MNASTLEFTGSSRGGLNRIHVDEHETGGRRTFSVYCEGKHWKHVVSEQRTTAPFWIKQKADGHHVEVTDGTERWLNKVYANAKQYPRVQRFSRDGENLRPALKKLMDAYEDGNRELMCQILKKIEQATSGERRSFSIQDIASWETLPRFDPTSVTRTKWLIDSFLAERNIQLVVGERGSFKITLLLHAAKCVVSGEPFLGMKTRRRRVLYLDYENPQNVIKARNDDLELGLPDNQNLVIWDRFGDRPAPRPGDPWLEDFVRDCVEKTGFGPWIIFDSFSSLLKPGEGGEFTGQIAPIYVYLRKLADLGATITVLDHTRKNDPGTVYGGQDKEAKVDSIHHLLLHDKDRVYPVVRVESWLKRQAPKGVGTYAFEIRSERDQKGNWHILELVLADDPEVEEKRKNIELLQELIRRNPMLGQDKLADKAAERGLARDKAIELLKSGCGVYWNRKTLGHGKFQYTVR